MSSPPPSCSCAPRFSTTVESVRTHVGTAWEGIVGALVRKKYGKDLTRRLTGRGKLVPLIGWDDEVRQCIQILCEMGKHNPIIICEPGVSGVAKTTIAERLAQRIVQGDVPDRLLNRKLIYLDMVAGTNYEKMLKVVSKEATSSNGQTILFIDLVGAGATSGAMDAACNLFKTMFRQGKLQCVAATTAEEYSKYIEKDSVLARSFQQVSVKDTISILRGIHERYELRHSVQISDKALVSSEILADRCITDDSLPDKAIDLVNEAAMKQHCRGEVSDLNIAEIVSKCSSIHVSNQPAEREKLLRLEDDLKQRVVGQDMAVKSVANAILYSGLGLSDPNRPLASFMFMGSSGVGKTELAKTLADYLFNTGNALVTMDISDYMGANAVSHLIGVLPGYGCYEGEPLTEVVRRRPFSVIVFEWIEKAHHDALNILIRILEDGRINDSQGRTVSFSNSVIIMTTNIGSHLILNAPNTKEVSYDIMKKQAVDLAWQTFDSRLMDCIDEYVVFKSFDVDEISNIVEIQMRLLKERLNQKNIELHYSKEAIEVLAKLGFKPNSGARPVHRVIQKFVENEIAMGIVRGDIRENETVLVDVDENSDLPPGKRLRVRKLERDSSIEAICANKESSFLVA